MCAGNISLKVTVSCTWLTSTTFVLVLKYYVIGPQSPSSCDRLDTEIKPPHCILLHTSARFTFFVAANGQNQSRSLKRLSGWRIFKSIFCMTTVAPHADWLSAAPRKGRGSTLLHQGCSRRDSSTSYNVIGQYTVLSKALTALS